MRLKSVVGYAGEWFCLPLCFDHHQGEHGIHTDKQRFEELYGTEKELWNTFILQYQEEAGFKPMSAIEHEIIMERG